MQLIDLELIEEWEGLIHNKDGPWDWEAIKNHDIYKYSIGGTSDAVLDDKITENVKELVENMSEREYSVTDGLIDTYATLCNPLHWAFGGVSSWLKTDEQEEFIAAIERKEEELTEEEEKFRKEIEVIDASLNTVQGDEKTFGLKYESNWLLENTEKSILSKIKKIKNRKRVSQEEVKMDNDEIKGLIKEYTTHFDNYNDLRKSGKSLYLTRSRLVRDAEDMYKEIGDFDKINDAIGRNHSLPLEMAVALTNGVIELGQGIGTAAEAIRYYTNPFGRLGDYLVDSGAFDETPVLKSFIDVAQTIQGGFTRFDDDAKTTSGTEWLHGKIDQAQEYLNSTVEKPQQFSDIDSISDAGEWAATMFAGQVPQLAL